MGLHPARVPFAQQGLDLERLEKHIRELSDCQPFAALPPLLRILFLRCCVAVAVVLFPCLFVCTALWFLPPLPCVTIFGRTQVTLPLVRLRMSGILIQGNGGVA
ncbi:hypothetical protein J3459_014919 [Metarhizium acridum]|nr:hypothetical protein J3459_014919 [Metarhizium acridum]